MSTFDKFDLLPQDLKPSVSELDKIADELMFAFNDAVNDGKTGWIEAAKRAVVLVLEREWDKR